MRKLIALIGLIIILNLNVAFAYTVKHITNVPNSNYNYYDENIYDGDLTRIEKYLFRQTYRKESNSSRLSRIEKELFNQNYPSMSISQRMNNALANYRGNDYDNGYYSANQSNYYPQTTIKNRLMNSLIGQPTGMTPSILTSPYINKFGPSYNRGYYGNNGWGYHNVYRPTMTGAGIHILD